MDHVVALDIYLHLFRFKQLIMYLLLWAVYIKADRHGANLGKIMLGFRLRVVGMWLVINCKECEEPNDDR
jgi:hypothetical protein